MENPISKSRLKKGRNNPFGLTKRSNTIFVSDMSSSIGSRDLSEGNLYDDFGIIFAGAQKNFGTSGLTFTLIRDDVLERIKIIN